MNIIFGLVAAGVAMLAFVIYNHFHDRIPFLRHEGKLMYKSRLAADYFPLKCIAAVTFKAIPEVEHILCKRSRSVSWAELYSAEKIITMSSPPELLRERWDSLVAKFRDIASDSERKLAEENGLLEGKPPADDVAIKSVELVDRIQKARRIAVRREALKNGVSFVIAVIALSFLVAMVVVYLSVRHKQGQWPGPPPMAVMLFCGALGGFVSAQARIQAIPDAGSRTNDLSIVRLTAGVLLAIFTGALGALFLQVLVIAGLLAGDIMPRFAEGTNGEGLMQFLENCRPESHKDIAKMVVWSFAAGFSERLVPDQIFFLTAQLPQARKE